MRTIEARELKKAIESNDELILIDVLPRESYETRHIPGARSVPYREGGFTARVDAIASGKDDTIVVYCTNETCPLSDDAATDLREAEYTNVFDFAGGLKEWRSLGYRVERGSSVSADA